MNTERRAVVFDLDGTLIDSMPLVLRAYAHAIEPFVPGLGTEELRAALGGPPTRIFAQLIADPAKATEALVRMQDYSLTHWKTIQPFTGALPLFAELGAAGVATGIWTGRERESTAWLLKEHGLAEWIQATVCGDDLATHKPDPEGLAAVLQQLHVSPENAIFVGDSEVDVLAGAALHVRTVFITHGRDVPGEIRAAAWRVVEQPPQAFALLREGLGPASAKKAGLRQVH